MQQRPLMFFGLLCPHEAVWSQLNDEQRLAVVDVLARLMAQTAMPPVTREENVDD